jgi:hypothetical protein
LLAPCDDKFFTFNKLILHSFGRQLAPTLGDYS